MGTFGCVSQGFTKVYFTFKVKLFYIANKNNSTNSANSLTSLSVYICVLISGATAARDHLVSLFRAGPG